MHRCIKCILHNRLSVIVFCQPHLTPLPTLSLKQFLQLASRVPLFHWSLFLSIIYRILLLLPGAWPSVSGPHLTSGTLTHSLGGHWDGMGLQYPVYVDDPHIFSAPTVASPIICRFVPLITKMTPTFEYLIKLFYALKLNFCFPLPPSTPLLWFLHSFQIPVNSTTIFLIAQIQYG